MANRRGFLQGLLGLGTAAVAGVKPVVVAEAAPTVVKPLPDTFLPGAVQMTCMPTFELPLYSIPDNFEIDLRPGALNRVSCKHMGRMYTVVGPNEIMVTDD